MWRLTTWTWMNIVKPTNRDTFLKTHTKVIFRKPFFFLYPKFYGIWIYLLVDISPIRWQLVLTKNDLLVYVLVKKKILCSFHDCQPWSCLHRVDCLPHFAHSLSGWSWCTGCRPVTGAAAAGSRPQARTPWTPWSVTWGLGVTTPVQASTVGPSPGW